MLELLALHGSTIVVGAAVALIIAFSAYGAYKGAKSSPCGGNCSGCGDISHCPTQKTQ